MILEENFFPYRFDRKQHIIVYRPIDKINISLQSCTPMVNIEIKKQKSYFLISCKGKMSISWLPYKFCFDGFRISL
ncbi:hypothetical protein QW060_21515 [Myroides ceti]|uniref:Uncharacterized protein n=1 Tax=Paenimyroides ceti TaxID=395087 RepID=A0ABT8CZL3_9FLAO|nr:hypothetical protein [Paenimyroides ceti]MDN3708028.1 hypothetical protein [Paenimyroides ceti]MDN3709556.1 hypothetical protein [Paenimyroides ceti]